MNDSEVKDTISFIGKEIRAIRQSLGLRQNALGVAAGVKSDLMSKLESGKQGTYETISAVLLCLRGKLSESSLPQKTIEEIDREITLCEQRIVATRSGKRLVASARKLPLEPSAALPAHPCDDPKLAKTLAHLRSLIEQKEYEAALVDVLEMFERDHALEPTDGLLPKPTPLTTEHHSLCEILQECRENISRPVLAQLLLRECNKILVPAGKSADASPLPVRHWSSDEELKSWLASETRLSQLLVSAKSRLKHLEWHGPYKEDWRFIDQDIAPASEADTPSKKASGGPLSPTDFWGTHAFLRDIDSNALHTLYTRVYDYRPEAPIRASHRVANIVPRMIVKLLESRPRAHNFTVACADVAPTKLNRSIRIRPARFFDCYVGTYSVGTDAYTPEGVRDFDGTSLVAEDGQWLLLRSNHTAKPIRVVVLLMSTDGHLIITLQDPDSFRGADNWNATAASFAHPQDFVNAKWKHDQSSEASQEHGPLLVEAISESARRIMIRTLHTGADGKDLDMDHMTIHVTGFSLDVLLGLQPVFFTLCVCDFEASEIKRRLEATGRVCRILPLVEDNPSVSLIEAYDQPRFEQAETLRAAFFFAKEWLENIPNESNGREFPRTVSQLRELKMSEVKEILTRRFQSSNSTRGALSSPTGDSSDGN